MSFVRFLIAGVASRLRLARPSARRCANGGPPPSSEWSLRWLETGGPGWTASKSGLAALIVAIVRLSHDGPLPSAGGCRP
jgi:hypothetical protein